MEKNTEQNKTMRTYLFAFLSLFVVLTSSLEARPLTADEKTSLDKRVAEFDNVIRNKEFSRFLDFIPQKLLEQIAEQSKLTIEKLKEGTTKLLAKIMANTKFNNFNMKTADVDVTDVKDKEGKSYSYTFFTHHNRN